MPRVIDYYFSLVSPWAYIGHGPFMDIVERHGVEINYKPVFLGRAFAETGGRPLAVGAPAPAARGWPRGGGSDQLQGGFPRAGLCGTRRPAPGAAAPGPAALSPRGAAALAGEAGPVLQSSAPALAPRREPRPP